MLLFSILWNVIIPAGIGIPSVANTQNGEVTSDDFKALINMQPQSQETQHFYQEIRKSRPINGSDHQ